MAEWMIEAGVIGLPLAAALACALAASAKASGNTTALLARAIVAAALAAAVIAAIVLVTRGGIPLDSATSPFRLDTLALLLSVLVLGLSLTIQVFATRYLRGDTRQTWFVAGTNLLTASTVIMVCAATVLTFAIAWIAAGVCLLLLLNTYRQLPQARTGVRRTALRFGIADTAFATGIVTLIVSTGGDIRFDELARAAASLTTGAQLTIALLLTAGALARSSQVPFQGWLAYTLAAPTPVSALMHAGVVNAGAILLLRFAPAITPHRWVMILIFAAGAATLVYATALRLVKPDVKGRLVYSTMAQMGFMIMACGLGAFAAAIFHLIAHSLFKSTLFLGAGAGVRTHATQRDRPAPLTPGPATVAAALAIALVVPAGTLILARLTIAPEVSAASIGLLVFVAAAGSVTLAGGLLARLSAATAVIGIVSIGLLAFGYTAFLTFFTALLPVDAANDAAPVWLLIAPAVGLATVALLARGRGPLPRVRDALYIRFLSAALAPTHP